MKKLIFFLFIALNIILFISCDDNVNPKTDFKDVYALELCDKRRYFTSRWQQ